MVLLARSSHDLGAAGDEHGTWARLRTLCQNDPYLLGRIQDWVRAHVSPTSFILADDLVVPGPGWLDPIWMIGKTLAMIFFFIWIRATLPRPRYDQLMALGWKALLPLATLNVLVTAVLVTVL